MVHRQHFPGILEGLWVLFHVWFAGVNQLQGLSVYWGEMDSAVHYSGGSMKSTLALFAALALSPIAQAQTAPLQPHTPPTPAVMAQHEVQRYTTLLSLTSAQV